MQNEYICNAKGVHSDGKSCPFAAKRSFFEFVFFADFAAYRYNSLCISDITKTAQNSRILSQGFPCALST